MRTTPSLALILTLLPASSALAQSNECPSGDPTNCHPVFEGCAPGTFHEIPVAGSPDPALLEIANNASTLHLTIHMPYEWFVTRVRIHAGSGAPPSSPAAYAHDVSVNPARATFQYDVPMFSGCGQIAVVADVATIDFFGGISGTGTMSLAAPINYCSSCVTCCVGPGNFRTHGLAAWSARASDHPAASYLAATFDAAFPSDLWLGGQYSISVTSAGAARELASSSGPARSLASNFVDPSRSALRNTLAAHALSLALNLGFDAADPHFSPSSFSLGNLVIRRGRFAGQTVRAFNDRVGAALGRNGGVDMAPAILADMVSTIVDINENFADGAEAGTALACPAP